MKKYIIITVMLLCGCSSIGVKADAIADSRAAEFKIVCAGGTGSGVMLENGKILTAAHVVTNEKDCKIQSSDLILYPAKIEKIDKVADLALLNFVKGKPVVRGIAIAELCPPQYADIYVISHPLGFNLQVYTTGNYQGNLTNDDEKYSDLITAQITFGSSGGPVFYVVNGIPKIIGIVDALPSSKETPTFYLAFIINLKTIKEFLK